MVIVCILFGDSTAGTARAGSFSLLYDDIPSLAWDPMPLSRGVNCAIGVSTISLDWASFGGRSLPLLTGDDKELFKGAFRSSELKLLTLDEGATGLSLRLLTLLSAGTVPD